MRRFRALGATLLVLGLAMLPAVGALFQLGAALAAIDRLHGVAGGGTTSIEMVGSFDGDLGAGAALRLHPARVRRRR